MKNRLLFLTLALTLTVPAIALRAEPPPAGAAPAAKEKDDETELGRTMSKLNGAWRKLRKQAADATANASSLELAATVKAAAEKAVTLEPAMAADKPAADRPAFIAAYQKQMKDFIALADQLAATFKANDNAAAQALIQKMGAAQKEGHKEFKKPDQH